MTAPEVRMIVSDLDGTLLGQGGCILAQNAALLRQAADRGIIVAIASGRLAWSGSRFALNMGLPECRIIGMNGAHILDSPYGGLVSLTPYEEPLRSQVLRILRDSGCVYNIYTDHGVFTNRVLTKEGEDQFRSHFAGSGVDVVITPEPAEYAFRQQVVKFLAKQKGGRPGGYEQARQALLKVPGIYLTSSTDDNFEIMQTGLGKVEAVTALAQHEGIPMDAVMAFGDYDNDEGMLRACGYSVAMGNASPSALAAARYQTAAHTEAGVARAIEAYFAGEIETMRIR